MIPEKKKTPEQIAALREGLGIPPVPPPAPSAPLPAPPPPQAPLPTPPPQQAAPAANQEAVIHLNLPPLPISLRQDDPKPKHSLRKHDLPLAPSPVVATHRTAIPTQRHDPRDVAEIRKREALAAIQLRQGADPAAHLRKQTASPYLYVPGYLCAIAAAISAYLRAHHLTPAALIAITLAIILFIALRKPRSRHHAALLFIVIFLTVVFGYLHYAPLFENAP